MWSVVNKLLSIQLNSRILKMILPLLINFIIWSVFKLLQLVYIPIYVYKSLQKPKFCPPIKSDILLCSATELARKIVTREITSEEVIQTYIQRINDVNPLLNAVVENRFELARKEAREVDEFLKSTHKDAATISKETPLLGVPITVKQSIRVAGMSHNAGSKVVDRSSAETDCEAIRQVKRSGAIILVTTNTPEYCLSWDTYNNVTGRTRNPYDSRRSCGGSSGGEAALLSSAASVIGLASDVGGSIRSPAMFCGVFGHKPTRRLVSIEGHKPKCIYTDKWSAILNYGPMARYACDLPLMLNVLSDDVRRGAVELNGIDVKDIKIYFMENDGGCWLTSRMDPENTQALRRVLNYFEGRCNTKPEKVRFEGFKQSPSLSFLSMLNLDGVDSVFDDGKLNFWSELLKFFFGLSDVTLPIFTYEILSASMKRLTTKEALKNIAMDSDNLKKEVEDKLGDDGVLIYPSFTTTALFPNQFYSKAFDFTYFALFNVLGLPATTCPIGFNSYGLPMGIQVIAKSNCDGLCLKMAEVIEKSYRGWQMPPSL